MKETEGVVSIDKAQLTPNAFEVANEVDPNQKEIDKERPPSVRRIMLNSAVEVEKEGHLVIVTAKQADRQSCVAVEEVQKLRLAVVEEVKKLQFATVEEVEKLRLATLVEVEKLRLASGEAERQSLVAIQEVCRQRCGKNVEDSYAEKSQKDGDDQTKRISKKKDKEIEFKEKEILLFDKLLPTIYLLDSDEDSEGDDTVNRLIEKFGCVIPTKGTIAVNASGVVQCSNYLCSPSETGA